MSARPRRPMRKPERSKVPVKILGLFYGVNIDEKDSDTDAKTAPPSQVEHEAPPSPSFNTTRKTPSSSPVTTPVSRRSFRSRPSHVSQSQSKLGSDITFNLSRSMLDAFDDTIATRGTRRPSNLTNSSKSTKSRPRQSAVSVAPTDATLGGSKESSVTFDMSQSMLDAFDDTIATRTTKSRPSNLTDSGKSTKSKPRQSTVSVEPDFTKESSVSFNLSQSMMDAFEDTIASKNTTKTRSSTESIKSRISEANAALRTPTQGDIEEEAGSDELFSGEDDDASTPKAQSPNTSRSIATETIAIVPQPGPPSKLRLSMMPPSVPTTATKSRLSTLPNRSMGPVTSGDSSGPRSSKRNRSSMIANSPRPGSSTSTPVSKRAPTNFSTPKSSKLDVTVTAGTQTSFGETSEQTQTSDILAASPYLGEPMEVDPRTPTPPRNPRPRKSVGFRQDVQVSDNSREFIPLKDSTHRFDVNGSAASELPLPGSGLSLPSTITRTSSTLSAASTLNEPNSAPPSKSGSTTSAATDIASGFKVPQLPFARTKLRLSTYMAPTHASEAKRSTSGSDATNSPLCSKTMKPRRTISHVTTVSSQSTGETRRPIINFADPQFAQMRKQEWQKTPPAKIPTSRLERMEQQGGEKLRFRDESEAQTMYSMTSKSGGRGAGDTFDVSQPDRTSATFTVSEKGVNSSTTSMKSSEKTFTVPNSTSSATVPFASSSNEGTMKNRSTVVLSDSDDDEPETRTPKTRDQEDSMETPKSTRRLMPLPRKSVALAALNDYGTPSFGPRSTHPCSLAARLAGVTFDDDEDAQVESSRRAKKRSSGISSPLEISPIVSQKEAEKKTISAEVVDDSLQGTPKKTVAVQSPRHNVRPPSDDEEDFMDEEEEEDVQPKTLMEPRPNVRPPSDDEEDFLDEDEEEEAPSSPERRKIDLDSSVFSLGTPGREKAGSDNVYMEPMSFDDEPASSDEENVEPKPSSSKGRRRSVMDPDELGQTNVFDDTMNDTIITPNKMKVMREKPRYMLAKPKIKKAAPLSPEEANLRRSTRTRVPRLNKHLGQRVVYERGPDGLPEIAGITEVEVKDKKAIKYMNADEFQICEKEREAKRRQQKRKQFAKQQRAVEAGGYDS